MADCYFHPSIHFPENNFNKPGAYPQPAWGNISLKHCWIHFALSKQRNTTKTSIFTPNRQIIWWKISWKFVWRCSSHCGEPLPNVITIWLKIHPRDVKHIQYLHTQIEQLPSPIILTLLCVFILCQIWTGTSLGVINKPRKWILIRERSSSGKITVSYII